MVKDKDVLLFKDAIKLINIDLSKENPFDHPWII